MTGMHSSCSGSSGSSSGRGRTRSRSRRQSGSGRIGWTLHVSRFLYFGGAWRMLKERWCTRRFPCENGSNESSTNLLKPVQDLGKSFVQPTGVRCRLSAQMIVVVGSGFVVSTVSCFVSWPQQVHAEVRYRTLHVFRRVVVDRFRGYVGERWADDTNDKRRC